VEDEPRQKVFQELRLRAFDRPWGLPTDGTLEDLPNLSAASVRAHYERCFRPNGTIIGIAGRVEFEPMRDLIGEVFGDWDHQPELQFETAARGRRIDHVPYDSTQTHIGIAYDAVPYVHPDYYASWAAVSILGGGMSSRLFTEVREKRGLCYSVYATLSSLKDEARVIAYAGTTSERAQKTLDTTLAELVRLGEGIEPAELDRCKAGAKSALIMEQESTRARASSLARNWFHLGRVLTLDEVYGKVEGLTVPAVLDYVHAHPARDFTIVTLGPEPLDVPQ
ncbi:MAG: M16 family metallopeptidase, partial [Planctomycetaceae bacterium]